jgi:predicted TPR repeat methyltransferase
MKTGTVTPDRPFWRTAPLRHRNQKGDDEGARQWLEEALRRNSQNLRAWYELGWLEARAGNNKDAEKAYEKVLFILSVSISLS